jgi:hypothetical protein
VGGGVRRASVNPNYGWEEASLDGANEDRLEAYATLDATAQRSFSWLQTSGDKPCIVVRSCHNADHPKGPGGLRMHER